jgi:hypothetical protein
MPQNDISVNASLANAAVGTNFQHTDLSQANIQKLTAGAGTAVSFTLQNTNRTNTIGQAVTINFAVLGTDAVGYSAPASVSAMLSDATVFSLAPVASPISWTQNAATKVVTLGFQCSQAGKFYYAMGTTAQIDLQYPTLNASVIQNATESRLLPQSPLRSDVDPSYAYFGYGIIPTASVQAFVTIPQVASNFNYTVRVWCINQVLTYSAFAANTTQVTQDNGGRMTIVAMNTSQSLTAAQKQGVASVFVGQLNFRNGRVQTEDGDFGTALASTTNTTNGTRLLQNATTNTTTTNTTTTPVVST